MRARVSNASIWATEGREESGTGGGSSPDCDRSGIGGRVGSAGWESLGLSLLENPSITGVFAVEFTGVLGGNFLGCGAACGSGVASACGFAGREGSLGGRPGRAAGAGSIARGGCGDGGARLGFPASLTAASFSLLDGGSLGRLAGS